MVRATTPSRLHRCFAIVIVSLVIGVAGGCTGSDSTDTATPETTVPSTSVVDDETTSSTPSPEERLGGCPNRPAGSSGAEFSDDGTFAVTIDSVDLETATATVDVVQWLVGQDAADAYAAETGETGGPPNDYYVVNENPLVREVSIADDAVVRVVELSVDGSADVSGGTLEGLPDYLLEGFSSPVWWATLEDGTIVELCEQYVP